MTVYTVIGHITNAILTIEQLQIPSNLSGGPQFEVSSVKWNILKSDMSKEAWKHFESEYRLVSCTR